MTECNKIIHKVAREMLKPRGFVQLGSGRFYAKDYGYFLILITYIPLGGGEGTNIQVFVSFYFDNIIDDEIELSRDYNDKSIDAEINKKKLKGHYDENAPDKFEREVREFTELAIKGVDEYSKLEDLDYAWEAYHSYSKPTLFWYYYSFGLLSLLDGHYEDGIEYLKKTVEELKDPTLPYKFVPKLRKKIEKDLVEKYTGKEKAQEEMVKMVNYMRGRFAAENRYKRLKLDRPFELDEKYK